MSALDLARPELLELRPYVPGAYDANFTRLNANESPWRLPSDTSERGLNVYPPPRPEQLGRALAKQYGAPADNLLVTRGSSEAIDVLIRSFCRSGKDSILICPPTFGMYRHYALIQGAEILTAPLDAANDFNLNADDLLQAVQASTKIVFLCTPNNPTGTSVPHATIQRICTELAGRALVVIDEAYFEFSSEPDCLEFQQRFEHVTILRTLSKFTALAGARCGALLAAPDIIQFLGRVLPPYTFPTPSIEIVMDALKEDSLAIAEERVALIRRERHSLSAALETLPEVVKVTPSDANFLLVRVRHRDSFIEAAKKNMILVREFDGDPALADCVRITIGRPEDNDRLIEAIGSSELRNGA